MRPRLITPILNVTSVPASFEWFEKLGWSKTFEWGDPVTFGGVSAGGCEIFLCQDGQGGRGRSSFVSTFGPGSDQSAERGVWLSVWVEDVDEVATLCARVGVEVTLPPSVMPWDVREMHVRHPDGHVFRVSCEVDHHDHDHDHDHENENVHE